MDERKSLFKRGAEFGLPMGLFMSTISVCSIFADRLPMLSWVVLILLFAGPWVIGRFQRQYLIEEDGNAEYAALWMIGILMVIYGALITGLITWAVLQWIRPGYIYEQMQAVVDIYGQMPELKDSELLQGISKAIEVGALPSPIELVINMFWVVTFSGSLLSAITAAFAMMWRPR